MRNMSAAFRRAIFDGRVDYTNTLVFTFEDNSTLTLTNENIAMGGTKMDDAVSDDGVFQVGAVIVNSATFTLINIEGDLDGYEFGGAQVVWYVGMDDLDDGTDATPNDGAARMGTFYVDETEYDGHMITLHCLDNAGKLDVPFSWGIPGYGERRLAYLIGWACDQAGVSPGASWNDVPHYDYVVSPPSDILNASTCRQVISWLLQMVGYFARCNAWGYLEFHAFSEVLGPASGGLYGGYFDQTTQPTYQSGDDADGGSFNPWNTGGVYDGGGFTSAVGDQGVNLIQSCFSQKLSLHDIEITGVKVVYKTGDGGSSASVAEAMTGTAGYVISVEDNPLINTTLDASLSRNTINDVLGFIGASVIGLKFRAGEIVHPSDPAIEAGDVGFYWDVHQNQHAILISSTEFSGGVTQRTVSSAASKENNASTRYSNTTRNYTDIMSAINGDYIRKQLAIGSNPVITARAANNVEWLQVKTNSTGTYLEVSGTGISAYGVYLFVSDTKLKKNISASDVKALKAINGLEVSSFDWKDFDGHVNVGLVANQVEKVIPDAVFEVEQPEGAEYDTLKQIDGNTLTVYCIKAIQELSSQVDTLRNRVRVLEKAIADKGA